MTTLIRFNEVSFVTCCSLLAVVMTASIHLIIDMRHDLDVDEHSDNPLADRPPDSLQLPT